MYDYFSPPMFFEQKTGLLDIGTPWVMPGNCPHATMEESLFEDLSYIMKRGRNFGDRVFNRLAILLGMNAAVQTTHLHLTAIFDQFKTLNPELKEIDFVQKHPLKTADAIMGITSQFNLDDLKFFLSTTGEQRQKEISTLKSEIEAQTGVGIFWAPSKNTLDRIRKQIATDPPSPSHHSGEIPKYLIGSNVNKTQRGCPLPRS